MLPSAVASSVQTPLIPTGSYANRIGALPAFSASSSNPGAAPGACPPDVRSLNRSPFAGSPQGTSPAAAAGEIDTTPSFPALAATPDCLEISASASSSVNSPWSVTGFAAASTSSFAM